MVASTLRPGGDARQLIVGVCFLSAGWVKAEHAPQRKARYLSVLSDSCTTLTIYQQAGLGVPAADLAL